jgi:hypothetical protein
MKLRFVVLAFCLFFVGSTAFSATYYIPQVVVGSNGGDSPYSTTFVFFNNNNTTSNVTLTLTGNDGSALKVNFPGVATNVSTYSFTLLPGATKILQTDTSGALVTGAATVTSDLAIGVSGLYTTYDVNGKFISEVGVQGTSAITDFILPVQKSSDGAINTGLAFYSPAAAHITLTLYTQDGVLAQNNSIDLAAGHHTAAFLHEFFTGYNNSSFSGTIKVHSDTSVAAVTLRQNSTYKATYTSIPVVATTSTQTTFNLAHFADVNTGLDQYVTTFMIFNFSNSAASVQLHPTKDDGSAVTLNFGSSSSNSTFSIPAKGSNFLVSDMSSNAAGAVQITSTNGVPIGVAAIYTQYSVNGTTISFNTEAGVQDSPALTYFTIPIDSKVHLGGFASVGTGFALYNPNAYAVTLTPKFLDCDGVWTSANFITLQPSAHYAAYFHELFPNMGVIQGSLSFAGTTETSSVSAMGLRLNSSPYNMTSFLVSSGTGVFNYTTATVTPVPLYTDIYPADRYPNNSISGVNKRIPYGVQVDVSATGTSSVSSTYPLYVQAISQKDGSIYRRYTSTSTAPASLFVPPGKYSLRVMSWLAGQANANDGVFVDYTSDMYTFAGSTSQTVAIPTPTYHNVSGTISLSTLSSLGITTTANLSLSFFGNDHSDSHLQYVVYCQTDSSGNGTFTHAFPDGTYYGIIQNPVVAYSTYNGVGTTENMGAYFTTFTVNGADFSLNGGNPIMLPSTGTISGTANYAGSSGAFSRFTLTAKDSALPDFGWFNTTTNWYPSAYKYYPKDTTWTQNSFGGSYSVTLPRGHNYNLTYAIGVTNPAGTAIVGTAYYSPSSGRGVSLASAGSTYNFDNLPQLPATVAISGNLKTTGGTAVNGGTMQAISTSIIGVDGNVIPNLRYYASATTDSSGNYTIWVLPGYNYELIPASVTMWITQ